MNMPAQNLQIPVWIIDDDQSMRWVLDKTLSNNGYQVNAFESGSVALASFKRTEPEQRPSLIITDVRMPGLSGSELAARARRQRPELPVLFISGYTGDALDPAWRDAFAVSFLAKPFSSEQLLDKVRELLVSHPVA